MAEENKLTIPELEKELERMNDALRQVLAGYEDFHKEFEEYISPDPGMTHRYKEFQEKAEKRDEGAQEEIVPGSPVSDSPERLSSDLDEFAQAFDPYEYADTYDAGSYEQTVALLTAGDTKPITDWLKEILEEEPDNQEARDLMKRVEDLNPGLVKTEEEEDFAPQKLEEITCLLVRPRHYPEKIKISNELNVLQQAVGGLIQAVYPFEDQVAIICNEEGKVNNLELNRALHADDGSIYDVISGDFLIVGLTEDDFGSLSPELMEKYEKLFHTPEQFMSIGDNIVAIPLDDEVKDDPIKEDKITVTYGPGETAFGKETVYMSATVIDKEGKEQELYAQCFINPDAPRQGYDYLKEVIKGQADERAGIKEDQLEFMEFTDFKEDMSPKDQTYTEKAEAYYPSKETNLPYDIEIHSLKMDEGLDESDPAYDQEPPEHEKPR